MDILSSKEENADYFLQIINQVSKGLMIRKWAKLAGVDQNPKQNNKKALDKFLFGGDMRYKMLEPIFTHDDDLPDNLPEDEIAKDLTIYKLSQKWKEEEQNVQKPLDVRFGDIIYLKAYVGQQQLGQTMQKGVIAGDGIASDKLECIPQTYYKNRQSKSVITKNGKLMFRKCLFQIVNTKKYYYHNLLKQAQKIDAKADIITELRVKAEEEKEENRSTYERCRGQNLIYGQEVQLFHIYSKTTLRLNKDQLAHQNCCREMSLEEEPNEFSNFVFGSVNNAKKQGEPIMYGDQVQLQSGVLPEYWLNINNTIEATQNFDQGLEVNSSEDKANLKFCCYMDFQTDRKMFQEEIVTNNVQSGDIIILENRSAQGRLAVRRKKELKHELREISFEADQSSKPVIMVQDYFNPQKVQKEIKPQFQIMIDKNNDDRNIQCLWEIQKEESFISTLPVFSQKFRIKNVATGLYLRLNKGKLSLTYNGNEEESLFYITPKKASKQQQNISYNQQIKIQSIDLGEICFMYALERLDKEILYKNDKQYGYNQNLKFQGNQIPKSKLKSIDDVCFIQKRKQDKKKRGRTLFDIRKADKDLCVIADRVSSLYPYLFAFYIFLQDWGLEFDTQTGFDKPKARYTHKKAFENQRDINNHINQLYQSLENLEKFLEEEGSKLKFIQKILLENGIINILIQILKLCHFQIYGKEKGKEDNLINLQDKKQHIPDRSAQKIASFLLDSKTSQYTPITRVYNILFKCIRGNSECSAAVLNVEHNYLQFFLQQLDYYPKNVKSLLRECVQFMEAEEEKEEENLVLWIQLLETLSENNIEKQSFIVELLGLSVSDSLERPLSAFQNIVRKKIFKPKKCHNELDLIKEPAVVSKTLLSFTQKNGHPIVVFNYDRDEMTVKKWSENNSNLTDLNRKAFIKAESQSNRSSFKFVNLHTQQKNQIQKDLNQFDMGLIDGAIEQKIGKRNTGTLEKYEHYVINVLLLYAALCKGRNQKMIDVMQETLGLTKDFIRLSISYCCDTDKTGKKHENLRYYRCFLSLYQIFVLDVPPLLRISQYSNKCFIIQDLEDFDINDKTYKLFKDIYIEEKYRDTIRKQFADKLEQGNSEVAQHELIKNYAKYIVELEDEKEEGEDEELTHSNLIIKEMMHGVDDQVKNPPQKFELLQHIQQHAAMQNGTEANKIARYSLEAFLACLKIIRMKIELGYNDMNKNMLILDILPNILYGFYDMIVEKERLENEDPDEIDEERKQQLRQEKELKQQNKTWVYFFFMECMRQLLDDETNHLLITKVLIETVNILQSIQRLQLEIEIVNKIKMNKKVKKELPQQQRGMFSKLGQNISNRIFDDNKKQASDSNESQINNYNLKLESFTMYLFSVLQKIENSPIIKNKLLDNIIYTFNIYKIKQVAMTQVEIIDDEYELSLFRKINGTSENKQCYPPHKVQQLVEKTMLYIKYIQAKYDEEELEVDEQDMTEKQKRKLQRLVESYENLSYYLSNLINMLELSDFEKVFTPDEIHKSKEEYQYQLQNIIRNAGIHVILLDLIINVNVKKFADNFFLEFYRKLVTFFEFFTKNNKENKLLVLNHLKNFLDLSLIPHDKESTIVNQKAQQQTGLKKRKPKQIKISDLSKSILKEIKREEQEHFEDYIDIIFKQILENNPFQEIEVHNNIRGLQQRSLTNVGINHMQAQAILQYMKILRSLTYDKEKKVNLQSNQKIILARILKEPLMSKLVQPIQEVHLRKPAIQFQNGNEYLKLRLHIMTIQLMTDSCMNYRLGIQEIQRLIMFDSLRNAISEIHAPFILKRPYLRCLFQVYINKVVDIETGDCNETITPGEISEIISKEIIPQLDPKNIYQYIEGILKPPKGEPYETVYDMRKVIIKEKINYFIKYREYITLAQEDQQKLKKGDEQAARQSYIGIIQDCSEFWRYLSKEGIIHFLLDTYDERVSQFKSGGLYDNHLSLDNDFSHAKTNLLKLKQLLSIIETTFMKGRGDNSFIDKYRGLITKVEDLVPLRTVLKSGTNYRIMQISGGYMGKTHIEQFETKDQDLFQGIGGDDKDDKAKNEFGFKKEMRRYLTRNRMDVEFFVNLVWEQKTEHKLLEKACYYVMNLKKKYSSLDNIQRFIQTECGIRHRQKSTYLDNQMSDFTDDNKSLLRNGLLQLFSSVQMFGGKKISQITDESDAAPLEDEKENEHEDIFVEKKKLSEEEEKQKKLEEIQQKKEKQKEQEELQRQLQMQEAGKKKIDEVDMDEVKDEYSKYIIEKITNEYKAKKKDISDGQPLEEDQEEFCEERLLKDWQVLKLLEQFCSQNEELSSEYIKNQFDQSDDQFSKSLESLGENMGYFLEKAMLIFNEQKVYFIKFMRLYLEARAPRPQEIEYLKSDSRKKKQEVQRKIETFKVIQGQCVQKGLHQLALEMLSTPKVDWETEFETLNFLIWILHLGNQESQNAIYELLKIQDRILCMNFFHYLRLFFQQDLEKQCKHMAFLKRRQELEKHSNFSSGKVSIFTEYQTHFEVQSKLILKLLQQMCENVNIRFQMFLSQQSTEEDQQLIANVNIVLEVSNFLSFFLEDEELSIKQKDEIICNCLDALNEFCTGYEKNQKIVCRNKRLFLFINNKIIIQEKSKAQELENNQFLTQDRSFIRFNPEQNKMFKKWHNLKDKATKKLEDEMGDDETEPDRYQSDFDTLSTQLKGRDFRLFKRYAETILKIKDREKEKEQDFNMFSSAVKFFLVMLTGNKDQDSIQFIIQSMDLEELLKIAMAIYEERIKNIEQKIRLETYCECLGRQKKMDQYDVREPDQPICCNYYCERDNLTPQDTLLIETGFNIFIFFSYLSDQVESETEWLTGQEKHILDLFRFKSDDDDDNVDLGWLQNWFKKIPCLDLKDDDEEEDEILYEKRKKHIKANRLTIFPEATKHQYKFNNTKSNQIQGFLNETIQDEPVSLVSLLKREIKVLENKENQIYKEKTVDDLYEDEDEALEEHEKRERRKNVFNVEPPKIKKQQQVKHNSKSKILEDGEEEQIELSIQKSDDFFQFYKKYLGTQEIIHTQTQSLQKVYFQKPFTSEFLTTYVKQHLIYEADRGSDQERIQYLIQNFQFYYDQMNHKQDINKYWGISWFVNYWKKLKDASFQIVLIICIVFITKEILKREDKYKQNTETVIDTVFHIATIIQITLSILVLIFCSVERYTISIEAGSRLGGKLSRKIQKFKESAGFSQGYLQRRISQFKSDVANSFDPSIVKKSWPRKIVMICCDFEFLYNVLYLVIAILSYQTNELYFALLLDIVKRYQDLQNVLKAITSNISQLAKFSLLGIAVMYIYAIIGWEYFRSDFNGSGDPGEPEYDYDKKFFQLVFYVIKEGLRSGGGITEAMNETDGPDTRNDFWARYLYDISFFIIINMLFVQMIFGIIIDTFGDLRQENNELRDEIEKKCFICGLDRSYIDQHSKQDMGWYHHIYLEHNVYHMLYYMIYVNRKHENDCDALEKSVKQSLESGKPDFIPIGYSIEVGEEPEKIDQDEMLEL